MQKQLFSTIVSIALVFGATFAYANPQEETPQQGLEAIVALYKAHDWEELVKNRCLSAKDVETEEAQQELIVSLSSQFSDSESLDALVTSYEAALSAEPRIESEGTVAIFASEVGSVRLSKMDNGAWGLRF